MQMTDFPSKLRICAALVVIAMCIRYLLIGSIMVPPFVTVAILVLLSFSYAKWPRTSAGVSLVPGILIPVFVLIGYFEGNVEFPLVVFDWILFGWLVWEAANELRSLNGHRDNA